MCMKSMPSPTFKHVQFSHIAGIRLAVERVAIEIPSLQLEGDKNKLKEGAGLTLNSLHPAHVVPDGDDYLLTTRNISDPLCHE